MRTSIILSGILIADAIRATSIQTLAFNKSDAAHLILPFLVFAVIADCIDFYRNRKKTHEK